MARGREQDPLRKYLLMITTFVQTVHDRNSWPECKASIEDSDIGQNYFLLEQGPRTPPREHFLHVLHLMGECSTPWALRLEDDVEVNRHILANIASWESKDHPDFGAGWLFDAGGTTRSTHDRIYQRLGKDRWHTGQLHCSQAVLLRTADIPRIRSICAGWFDANPGVLSQDIALSRAIAVLGKKICVHAPPLAEHLIKFQSSLGHANLRSHTTEGAFRMKWKRGATP